MHGRRTRNRADDVCSLVGIDEHRLIACACSRRILRGAINLDSTCPGIDVVTRSGMTVLWWGHLRINILWYWSRDKGVVDIMELARSVVGLARRWRCLHKRLGRLVQLAWLGRLFCLALPFSTAPDTEPNSNSKRQDSNASTDGKHYTYRDTRMTCGVRHVGGRTGTGGRCRCCT